MGYPKKPIIDAVRTAGFGAIGAGFTAVGAALGSPARIICINNLTDQTLAFSVDGANDQFVLPSASFKLLDISTNRTTIENFFLSEGTFFYVRHLGAAPTVGAVYVEIVRS